MKDKRMGVVKGIDAAGRMVIPREIRRTLGLERKDSVEIVPRTDGFLIRKYAGKGED